MKRNLYYFDRKKYAPSRHNIDKSNIADCYITDYSTGETYPLYMEVKCGHCEVCKNNKVNSFVARCEMETMMYKCKPIFLTLTYDEKNKPETGVEVRDLQKFFKRLRINLQRQGYRDRIRYVAVGEYGKNTRRPHYHAVIWNLHQTDFLDYREIGAIIKKSWPAGFEMHRLVDPSNNKSFYYTAKYLRKDCDVPKGCNKTFVCSSNRNGGIGSAFIDTLAGEIVKRNNIKPKFVNKWSGKPKEVILSKYILDRVFPTIAKSLPARVKQALRTLSLSCCILKRQNHPNISLFDERLSRYAERFAQVVYAPNIKYEDLTPLMQVSPQKALRDALEADIILDEYFSKGEEYVKRAQYLANRRNEYLAKLFMHVEEVTDEQIKHKAYMALKAFAAAAEREIL